MTIIEYLPELFCLDQIKTEYRACELLKQNPIQEKIVYLATPWSVLINRGKLGDFKIERTGDGFNRLPAYSL
jgi:hypothetical protein